MASKLIPVRYLPFGLSETDEAKQMAMLHKSRKMYRRRKYITRKRLSSYDSKPSSHLVNARNIYGIPNITPGKGLVEATGCGMAALEQIVRKGEGAYYS
jgi:hypothetical protein